MTEIVRMQGTDRTGTVIRSESGFRTRNVQVLWDDNADQALPSTWHRVVSVDSPNFYTGLTRQRLTNDENQNVTIVLPEGVTES